MSDKVSFRVVSELGDGQRLDNFLMRELRGVPKSHIYRIIRSGEVRVNKGRAKANTRLLTGDTVRIPPVSVTVKPLSQAPSSLLETVKAAILFEDKRLLVINKPQGLAVHGGSGISLGLIEVLRQLYPSHVELELVHRLDKDTSGVIVIAKKRSLLRELHALLREKQVEKIYQALLSGQWQGQRERRVDAPLLKNTLSSGERMVIIDEANGKPSLTHFRLIDNFATACLVEAKPLTGRTHQIRVHALSMNQAIIGDEKYGDKATNRAMRQLGCKRLFLHAKEMRFTLEDGTCYHFKAPLCPRLASVLATLQQI